MENLELHHDQDDVRKFYWEKQRPILTALYGGVQAYADTIEGLKSAFQAEGDANCIDGRTPGGVHLEGLGILLGMEKAAKILSRAGVRRLRSHTGCGAALEAYNRLSEGDRAKYENADAYAKDWTAQLAEYMGGIPFDHREVEPIFHPECVIYYDGTGKFDPATLDALPLGFMLSRRYVDPEHAKEVAEFALKIALEHGFGTMFGKGTEMMLIAIGDPSDPEYSLEKLTAELEVIASRYPDKVKVDGFVAPL